MPFHFAKGAFNFGDTAGGALPRLHHRAGFLDGAPFTKTFWFSDNHRVSLRFKQTGQTAHS
jgi:hypothetical protein